MQIIDTGLYRFSLKSDVKHVSTVAKSLYSDSWDLDGPVDFSIRLVYESLLRRFIKPQISFYSDQHSPFKPLPISQAAAVLEWGMNWCIAAHEFERLLIHSAVLVKNGKAIIFPALPGSGKSTLTAHLGLSDWDIYSDEMAIIDTSTSMVNPLFRPVCLKNNSIDLIKAWHPEAYFSPICKDTQKGDVAHVKVLTWEQYQKFDKAQIVAVVFPKYVPESELKIYQLTQLDAFNTLSKNAFNYNVLGADGFDAVARVIKSCRLFEIEYSDLNEVNDFLSEDVIG
ncbi:HprK-related kinase A [Aliiglaciecola sp. 3_MG-2023]|uniref:HprK-related kinase A n=1 Tax=Aliiglaciecola sp. 3_MG-2023 TaxID=3062644 RepID=UPI0026E3C034|nr:HprK-related kinase A [Aliiglaciecola sp. 3_MG-2023]MDO6694003.1 HprK-related kinase A [Aliiglaciecola sp. 3_MG-2023]